jgi:hypothetical protein
MEGAAAGAFAVAELAAADAFAAAAARAGVRRIVYLGGLLPQGAPLSRHLASRLAVEERCWSRAGGDRLRASIVIAARSRSFRFLVRLVERMPVLALPAWREHRTAPDRRARPARVPRRRATAPARLAGRSWDIGGPDVMTYRA